MHSLHESPELNNLSIAITNDITWSSEVYDELADDVEFLKSHPEMKAALVDIKVQYLECVPLHFKYANGEIGLPITLYVKNTNWKPNRQSVSLRKKVFGDNFLSDLSDPNKTIELDKIAPVHLLYSGPRQMSLSSLLNLIRVTYRVNFDPNEFQPFDLDTFASFTNGSIFSTLLPTNESRFVGSLTVQIENLAARGAGTHIGVVTSRVTAGKTNSQKEIPDEFFYTNAPTAEFKTNGIEIGRKGSAVPKNYASIKQPVTLEYVLGMMEGALPDVYMRSWNDPTYLVQSSVTLPIMQAIRTVTGGNAVIPNPLEWIADWMVKNKGWSEVKVYGNQLHCIAHIEIKGVTLRNSNVSS